MVEQTCIEKALTDRASPVLAVFKPASLTVVTAESCTGGLISAVLSQAKDAGEVLHGSFGAYSKANKAKALGVDAELLKREGSVNSEVVRQLVRGALDRSPADVAVAVSGVLGPSRTRTAIRSDWYFSRGAAGIKSRSSRVVLMAINRMTCCGDALCWMHFLFLSSASRQDA